METPFAERYGIRPDPSSVKVTDSHEAGWASVYAATYRHEGTAEPFDTLATPHQKITVVTTGTLEMASRSNGRWPMGARAAGSIGFTPAGQIDHLRWRALSRYFETSHLYVPQIFFLSAADEFRRIGSKVRIGALNGTGISDPIIAQLVGIIVDAAVAGMPELYAQSAARFLATHLVCAHCGWPSAAEDTRNPGRITTSRLANVIAFMKEKYMQQLSLEQLASEAGVSPHHFAHLFKYETGNSPHRYLTNLRLEASTRLLAATDKNIYEIALQCGYMTSSHFSEAFRRKYGRTPTEYRSSVLLEGSH